jgi:DNA polymerase-4
MTEPDPDRPAPPESSAGSREKPGGGLDPTGEVVVGAVGAGDLDAADLNALGVLHADMDAFYASVAVRSEPALAGRPLLIGGTGGRGVVMSASYEARRYGCRNAMPMARAQQLCPHAVVRAPDFAACRGLSGEILALFRAVTPLVEPLALDEAFLDVRAARRRLGSAIDIARSLRRQVREATGLTVTVGVGASKFVAKLASARGKPDGLLVVPPSHTLAWLHPLGVEVLPGVGGATRDTLHRYGLRTVGDLAQAPRHTLEHALGAAGAALHDLAWARDPRTVVPDGEAKSVGAEETYEADLTDADAVGRELLRACVRVGRRLRAARLAGRTVTVKVRFADFRTVTRSRTLATPTDTDAVLRATAAELLPAAWQPGQPVRLLGVSVSGLARATEPVQLTLGEEGPGWRDADRAADAVRDRFGDAAVTPAALARRPARPAPPTPRSGR